MKSLLTVFLVVVALFLSEVSLAQPLIYRRYIQKTGPRGGTVQGQSGSVVVPGKGGAVYGKGTVTRPQGGTASGQGGAVWVKGKG